MFLVSASNISKDFAQKNILSDISFSINEGDKIGLIGLNGSGKTTLLKMILGLIPADNGVIHKNKNLNMGFLEQQVEISSEKNLYDECLEVFENLIETENRINELTKEISKESARGESERLTKLISELEMLNEELANNDGYSYPSLIKGTLKGLGFKDADMEKPLRLLSGGEKARVMLAKLLLRKPNFILMDEPTNHLDVYATEWLENYLKGLRATMILISHDRYFLDKIVNRIFLIDHKKLTAYDGNYTIFMEKHKKDLEIQKTHYENYQDEIKRQKEIIKRFIKYGGERYNRLAKSRQKLIDRMQEVKKPDGENKKAVIRFTPKLTSGHEVYRGTGLKKSFPDKVLFSGIDFIIYRGDKLGLIGPNGVGKTTLFKMILGKDSNFEGEILEGTQVRPAYYEQELNIFDPEKTVIDDLWDAFPKMTESEIRGRLAQFLFFGEDVFKEVGTLSGGEKARLSLLKLMLSGANTLFMDEPTNHLDIDSKEVLENALQNYDGTVITISHDRYFLNAATNKILELSSQGIREFAGNYDYYVEKKSETEFSSEEEYDFETKTERLKKQKKERIKKRAEQEARREKKSLEKEIQDLEERLKEIDTTLSLSKTYEEKNLLDELLEEREALETRIEELYSKWVETDDDLEIHQKD